MCPAPTVKVIYFVLVLLSGLVLAGCAEIPRVESRLQRMQFHPNIYLVQAGDTLDLVAYRYGLSNAELVALNPGIETGFRTGMAVNVLPGWGMPPASGYGAGGVKAGIAAVPVAMQPQRPAATTQGAEVVVSPSRRPEPITVTPLPSHSSDTAAPADRAATAGQPAASGPREEVVARSSDFQPIVSDSGLLAGTADSSDGPPGWVWPTQGEVARGFAPDRVNGTGVDIAGVPGQEVRAASSGTVVYSGRSLDGAGNLVIVQHPEGLMSTYGYTDRLYVAEDDPVRAGDPIASLGWNASKESVLHFEVRRDGNPLNPLEFLPNP